MTIPDGTGFDALVFDWDGTVVDSHDVNYRALASALAAYGVTMTADWYRKRIGTSGADLITELALDQHPPIELPVDDIVRECLTSIRRALPDIRVNTIVVDVARRAAGSRLLAVASGGSRTIVMPTIDRTGLRELFGVVVTGEDARRGKPEPDLFLLAARRLGVTPARCLVYEDSPEGLEAARRAGMAAVDVRPYLANRPKRQTAGDAATFRRTESGH